MTLTPAYTPAEASARETFLALMWALSYPGRVYDVPVTAMNSDPGTAAWHTHESLLRIGEALLDLETSFYTSNAALAAALSQTGARALPPAEAAYHFYPGLNAAALDSIAAASAGTMLRPDDGATLIIGCAFAGGSLFRWHGPGIQTSHEVRLGGIPARFWPLRTRALRYPLGWDVYFVDHQHVIGLPRTTVVEAL